MAKYTLVPSLFFREEDARRILSELVPLERTDSVKNIELPEYEAVLVYCGDTPIIYDMIKGLVGISDFNKVMFQVESGQLHLVLAAGDKLLLANSYGVEDFVTAEYFIFAALQKFQINPEMTTVYHRGELAYEQKEQLFRYFLGVEELRQ
ncbi:MAG: DUF3822 family protein [Bacteroidales bacterium]|nr:DUF3822 family protein [Bacteroidales bacterium]